MPARQQQLLLPLLQARIQLLEVSLSRGGEIRQFLQLRQTERRLRVGQLQVVANLGEEVAMVVVTRNAGHLPLETATAFSIWRILVSTPAIPAPVAHAAGYARQAGVAGEHRSALPERDVVRRIETERSHFSERAQHLTIKGGTERVAHVLNHNQIVLAHYRHDSVHVGRVSERVREHQRARLRRYSGAYLFWIGVVIPKRAINEHRN